MKHLLLGLFVLLNLTACTFTPKTIEKGNARNQSVNKDLICAKQIDILPISINGQEPPKEAFEYSMNKVKKYTTDNLVVHKMVHLTIEKSKVNRFIQAYGSSRRGFNYLEAHQRAKLKEALKKFPNDGSGIVMIYSPILKCSVNPTRNLRGLAFEHNPDYNVVVYNKINIDNAPVISDTQAWKIVLTHEIGHRFKVPADKSHNDQSHCTHRECIMYARPDWRAVLSVLGHGMPYDFCDACTAELKEAKNSCKE